MVSNVPNSPTRGATQERRDRSSIQEKEWRNDPTTVADDAALILQSIIPFLSLLVGAGLALTVAFNSLPDRSHDSLLGLAQAIVAGSLGAMGTAGRKH